MTQIFHEETDYYEIQLYYLTTGARMTDKNGIYENRLYNL